MENQPDEGKRTGYDRSSSSAGRSGMSMNPNYFLPKPVKPGDEVDVTIENVASKGDGIARIEGFVVFVKGAKEGDKIKVRITDVKARFAIGEIVAPV
jgi:predicted RNA-binding protein with TRAM domain